MKGLILLACVVVSTLALPAEHEKDKHLIGAQVYRITPKNADQLEFLHKLLLADIFDFWNEPRAVGHPVDIMSKIGNIDDLKIALSRRGLDYKITISDVYDVIQKQKQQTKSGEKISFHHYNTYDEIQTWMDSLAKDYPDIVSLKSIGSSYEGRNMNMLTISSGGSGKPSIFVDGGIHAREWISPATVTYIMNEIITNNEKYKDVIDSVDMHFVPSINPDGYAYTHDHDRLWRKTRSENPNSSCKGADPNRNWDFHWDEVGASRNPCSEIYSGVNAFSEVEMRNVRDTISSLKDNMKVYLTFHSYSQLWMYPWGFTTALPDDWKDLDDLAQDAVSALTAVHGTSYEIGSSTNTIYAAAGGSDDWAKGVADVKYAYTVELRDTGSHGFLLPPSQIIPTGEETFAAFEVVMNFVKNTYGRK